MEFINWYFGGLSKFFGFEQTPLEEINEMANKVRDPSSPLFQETNKGVISTQTANILTAIVMILFLAGLYYVPSDREELEEMLGGQKKKKKGSSFQVPEKGGVLQNMPKDKDDNISLKLQEKIKISDDTFIFRFGFQNKKDVFGLPIGKHVVFTANIKGEEVSRKYTPISEITREGYIDFLIKVYYAGVHPRFPDGGQMS